MTIIDGVSLGQTVWTESILYSFKGGSDGAQSTAGLIIDKQDHGWSGSVLIQHPERAIKGWYATAASDSGHERAAFIVIEAQPDPPCRSPVS